MKKSILLVCLILAASFAHSQTRQISGTVTSSAGDTLLGAVVKVLGTNDGTVTNTDGFFTLDHVGSGKVVLVISYTGYTEKKVTVNENQSVVNITLTSDNTLTELVVIGYQTVKRKDLTGSVSSVGAEDLKDVPSNSAADALEGRVSGLQVSSTEGTPGADATVLVRGGNSITQDNSPLYIIDGIEVENGLAAISPQDIASVDLLKDAAATAIYGARGANGVMIITTKRGSSDGSTKISYNGFVGFQKEEKELSVLSPYQYVLYQYEKNQDSPQDSTNFAKTFGSTFDTLANYKHVAPVDWQKQVFGRSALTQTNNISLTGGNSTTQYNLSLTSNNQQGIMLLSDFKRYLLNFNLDHKFNKNLKVAFNTRYNATTTDGAGVSNTGGGDVNFLRQTIRYIPFLAPGQTLTSYYQSYALLTNSDNLTLINPILLNEAQYKQVHSSIFTISGYVDYTFNDYFTFRSTAGEDITNSKINQFYDTLSLQSKLSGNSQPMADITTGLRNTLTNSNVFTYSNAKSLKPFAKKNKITALIGEEIYQSQYIGYEEQANYFPAGISAQEALGQMGLGTPSPLTNGGVASIDTFDHLLSGFARVNYTYNDKYLFTLSYRADGSSKFSPEHEWAYFPAAAAAWRLSDESFMQSLKPSLTDAKIRASYGLSGNNRVSDFLYLTQFSPGNYYYTSGSPNATYSGTFLANPNLQWETTTKRNLGADVSFLSGRISLSADFYYNTTNNLLVSVAIPQTSGYLTQLQNVGASSNKGMEYQANATILKIGQFKWTANYNISFNVNRITSLGGLDSILVSSGWQQASSVIDDYIAKVGQPVGTMYGYENAGFYTTNDFNYNPATGVYTLKPGVVNDASVTGSMPMPGSIKYKDVNGDGTLSAADETVIGHAAPKFYGGLHQQFTYKNFDLSVFINYEYGNQVYNDNKVEFTNSYTEYANLLSSTAGAWSTINPSNGAVIEQVQTVNGQSVVVGAPPAVLNAINKNASMWIPVTTNTAFIPSSYAVENGSFIRINNVTFGYTLPAKLLQRYKIQTLRVYATANNLALITGYSGADPENNTRHTNPLTPGVDYSAYPRSRTYIFGVNLKF